MHFVIVPTGSHSVASDWSVLVVISVRVPHWWIETQLRIEVIVSWFLKVRLCVRLMTSDW